METNKYFVYDGKIIVAAQQTITGAQKYYKEGRKVYYGEPQSHKIDVTNDIKTLLNWVEFDKLNKDTI
jgi:hypothetical protein